MKSNAKPFLKWAGGKTQIISDLSSKLPSKIFNTKIIESYIEPFLGGGAFFFYLKNNFLVKKAYLFDINKELIIGYKVIKNNPVILIETLKKIEKKYLNYNDDDRKKYFFEIRKIYNEQRYDFDYINYNDIWITRGAYLIFLNKTCFNGLFRLNKSGGFNVPHGSYKNPTICDEENIINVNHSLQNTEIICDDFTNSEKYINKKSIVYFDPPYRPLNETSSFTSYSQDGFTDKDQERLSVFYNNMAIKGAHLILSNSDPKNNNPDDSFFEELYSNFFIDRIEATRMINCNGNGRGKIKELLITNY